MSVLQNLYANKACRLALSVCVAASLGACATPYTGPVEVTRFVAEQPVRELGTGGIAVSFEIESAAGVIGDPYEDAVMGELRLLGYATTPAGAPTQTAIVFVEREMINTGSQRNPVSVGGGGSVGTFGSGVGLGVGINLGGGQKPRNITTLSVRISDDLTGDTLWEGRSQMVTSTDSSASPPSVNANILAKALFKDFPGGNGETITLQANEFQE